MNLHKPLRGTALLASKKLRRDRVAAEQFVMRQARKRDGGKCRVPQCQFRTQKLPTDVCHQHHRGMGGDPQGTRTTLDTLVVLCRAHHGLYDARLLDINPLTKSGMSGLCQFMDVK